MNEPLTDEFDREVTGIRVSLTDRCNFNCVYCHNEGLGDTRGPAEPNDNEMVADDVARLLEVVEDLGIEKVKFTGGEPMLRQDLLDIIYRTPDSLDISMTTNGTFLPGRAEELKAAGLSRVNVSQDAIEPDAFAEITKSGAYEQVLEGAEAAVDAGLTPVKLNMVVSKHTASYVEGRVNHAANNNGLRLQLIEYMPELTGHPEWNIDISRVHNWLDDISARVEHREMHDRTRYWIASDDANTGQKIDESNGGMVEIVDPVENPNFCANCHRVRVTHEGYLKGCLNRNDDLRSMGEMSRDEIRETFRETVANRVPYYGEYMIQDDDGEWIVNEKYLSDQVQTAN